MGKRIKDIYRKAGIKPPKGKGMHTEAFHRRAVQIMKGYLGKGGLTKKEKQIAYATAMKRLGRNKSVNPSHRRKRKQRRKR